MMVSLVSTPLSISHAVAHSRQAKHRIVLRNSGLSFPSFSRRGGRSSLLVNISKANSAAGVVDLFICYILFQISKSFLCIPATLKYAFCAIAASCNQPPRPGTESCKHQIINRPGHPSFKRRGNFCRSFLPQNYP